MTHAQISARPLSRELRKLGNNVDGCWVFNLTKINSRKYHSVSARRLTRCIVYICSRGRRPTSPEQTRFCENGPPANSLGDACYSHSLSLFLSPFSFSRVRRVPLQKIRRGAINTKGAILRFSRRKILDYRIYTMKFVQRSN